MDCAWAFSSLFLMYQEPAERAMDGISPVTIPLNPVRFREKNMIIYMTIRSITAAKTVMSIKTPQKQLSTLRPRFKRNNENETNATRNIISEIYSIVTVTVVALDSSSNNMNPIAMASMIL